MAPLTRLAAEERALYDDLRFGRGVRLEQERIPFSTVLCAVTTTPLIALRQLQNF